MGSFNGKEDARIPASLTWREGNFFFIEEFQWFFIELSVRPGRSFVISAHLLPKAVCDLKKDENVKKGINLLQRVSILLLLPKYFC